MAPIASPNTPGRASANARWPPLAPVSAVEAAAGGIFWSTIVMTGAAAMLARPACCSVADDSPGGRLRYYRATHHSPRTRMTRQIIQTPLAPQAIGSYSQAVRAGNTVYLSGQIGIDPA